MDEQEDRLAPALRAQLAFRRRPTRARARSGRHYLSQLWSNIAPPRPVEQRRFIGLIEDENARRYPAW